MDEKFKPLENEKTPPLLAGVYYNRWHAEVSNVHSYKMFTGIQDEVAVRIISDSEKTACMPGFSHIRQKGRE